MAYLISETGTTGKINGPALFGFGASQARFLRSDHAKQ